MTQPLILHKNEAVGEGSLHRIYYAMGYGKAVKLIPSILTRSTRITSPVPIFALAAAAEDESTVDSLPNFDSSSAAENPSTADSFVSLGFVDSLKWPEDADFAETSALIMDIEPFAWSPCRWRQVGPLDYRHYAMAEQISAPLQALLVELTGEKFKGLLAEFTQLELGRILSFEVRRIQAGDYQMLNDCYPEPPGLDLIMCVVEGEEANLADSESSSEGAWYYLVEGETQFMVPLKTGLSLVYRTETCQRFQRRLSCRSKTVAYQILLTFAVDSTESHYECKLGKGSEAEPDEGDKDEGPAYKRRRQ